MDKLVGALPPPPKSALFWILGLEGFDMNATAGFGVADWVESSELYVTFLTGFNRVSGFGLPIQQQCQGTWSIPRPQRFVTGRTSAPTAVVPASTCT